MSFFKYLNTLLINGISINIENLLVFLGIVLITGYFINKSLTNN